MKQQDIEDLRQLIEFLKQHQVAEFDIDRGDLKIRLKFNPAESGPASLSELARLLRAAPAGSVAADAPALQNEDAASTAAGFADPQAGLHILKSPLVGTFFGSPSPGAPPYLNIGDHVDKNQVVCIIEAMKLMNEVDSDVAGTIVKCLVSNGQPVEFGQPLFAIRED
jgi:acetyl-CoA carboxylase biotin carboxyl carrier protein